MLKKADKIVISRTDSIGDVALTLPLVGIIKDQYPAATIIFLGNTYTKPIINCLGNIDEVWNWSEISQMEDRQQIEWLKNQNIDVFIHVFPRREIARLVKKANIAERIGTSHRLFHTLTCNHRVNFTRKNSDSHESQLNTKLLKPLGIELDFTVEELRKKVQFTQVQPLDSSFKKLLSNSKKNIVLHPKSKGSALEWGVSNFLELARKLDSNAYQVFFTGTEQESEFFRHLLPNKDHIIDLSGKMSLDQLIAFISQSDILVAASTGPLHIAGLSDINTIGLYTSRRPLHPGRWQPIGKNVNVITEVDKSERNGLLNISLDSVLNSIKELS